MKTPHVTHEYVDGCFVEVHAPKRPEAMNFVICCEYGDWSGFRTLTKCLGQQVARRRDGFYWIEER